MIKKKFNYQKQIYLKEVYKHQYTLHLLEKSLTKNHFIKPLERLSYFAKSKSEDNLYSRWSTYQKLICLISLSPKVNSRKYLYSRFFLNKQLDKLTIANTLK